MSIMKKTCNYKFLIFNFITHNFEEIDIYQKEKIIGKVPGVYDEGIYIKKWFIYIKEQCRKCKLKRTRLDKTITETRRTYH